MTTVKRPKRWLRGPVNCAWRRLVFVALVIVIGAGSLGASSAGHG